MAGPGWGPPRLDGFILTERLGSGTYATVYKAYAKVGAGRCIPGVGEASRAGPLCPPDPELAPVGARPRGETRRASREGPAGGRQRPCVLRWVRWLLRADCHP